MKTLEEVYKHLAETVYSEEERSKIYGFILGRFPHEEYDINFASSKYFQDFLDWFEKDPKDYFNKKDTEENEASIRMMSLEELKKILDDMKASTFHIIEEKECKNYKYTGLARIALINAKSQIKHPDLIEIIDSMLNETID